MKRSHIISIAIALVLGLVIGYRATILNARVTLLSERLVAVTAWGQTDVYVAAKAGEVLE